MEKSNTKKPQAKPAPTTPADKPAVQFDHPGKVQISLVQDAYGAYLIGGHTGSRLYCPRELAERMVASGHAQIVK